MGYYILKRLLLMVPTLIGVMVVNFLIIQAAPGGPVERMIAKLQDTEGTTDSSSLGRVGASPMQTRSIDDRVIEDLRKRYGFDKPFFERFILMMKNYIFFDFGDSYFKNSKVFPLIMEKLPVSISLGLWATLLIYLVSIPLGIAKAVRNGTPFDTWTSSIIVIGYAIPSFLFALTLIIFFAGGSFWSWFPLKGLTSNDFESFSLWGKIKDYFWHLALPTLSQVIGGFASLTLLSKNTFLEEIHKNYVMTARAQGLTEHAILMRHVFRNAMLVIIAGLPATLMHVFFSGSLLTEMIFSLDGLGYLGFDSLLNRDYPVVFASLYIFTLIGLVVSLLSDLTYTWVDPRINFQRKDGD